MEKEKRMIYIFAGLNSMAKDEGMNLSEFVSKSLCAKFEHPQCEGSAFCYCKERKYV